MALKRKSLKLNSILLCPSIKISTINNVLSFCLCSICLFAGCGDALSGSSGFITSENFPNNFTTKDCTWNITVPVGLTIKLTFFSFTLEPAEETDCSNNRGGAQLSITNVASDDNAVQFKLCGQKIPAPVYSVGNFIQLNLFTSHNVFPGFNASYEAISRNDSKLTTIYKVYILPETCMNSNIAPQHRPRR